MLYNPNQPCNPTNRTTRRSAFTLMELLVVVAILVVLAAVAVPSYFTYVDYSKRQTAKTSCYALAKAAETYHAATGEWPQNLQQLTVNDPNHGLKASVRPEHLQDPWGQQYQYQVPPAPHNGELGPDVFTVVPGEGIQIGNWK